MKFATKIIICAIAVTVWTMPALADWAVGDSYYMHDPQLPNPVGWDVNMVSNTLADDFISPLTGKVTDVHFWVSWQDDVIGQISSINLSIHADSYDSVGGFYKPGTQLWSTTLAPSQFTVTPYGRGLEGWYSPSTDTVIPDDHYEFFQVNVATLPTPFTVTEGNFYWLDISIVATGGTVGWKTSLDSEPPIHTAGVWLNDAENPAWTQLLDPTTGDKLNLAFVMTPEPSTLVLIGVGGLAFLCRRKK